MTVVHKALEAWVVEFYSPRCGTCAELAPLYEALAQRHSHRVHFGGVDIDTEAGMALAQRLDVLSHGVPAILSYTQLGSQHSNTVFSGWQIPTLEQLEKNLLAAVHPGGGAQVRHNPFISLDCRASADSARLHVHAQDDAAEGERIMKT